MTALDDTHHRLDDTQITTDAGGADNEPLVLETADPRRVRRILGVVAASLLALVVLTSGGGDGSVPLGVRRTEVLGTTFERPLPREDGAEEAPTSTAPVIITVPSPVAVDRPVPIVISSTSTPTTSVARPVLRTANGPSSPEITRFFVATERPAVQRPVEFRWWSGDADGHIRYVQVDFGDGREMRNLKPDRCLENPSDPVAEQPPFAHTYEEPGNYVVTLTVGSSGSCGNGPTQTVISTIEVQVGLLDVGTNVGA